MTQKKEEISMFLLGKKIPVEYKEVEISKVYFYEENPRIMGKISEQTRISQNQILKILLERHDVQDLMKRIQNDGGLQYPIDVVIENGRHITLEGSCRLACYKELNEKDAITYGKIRCRIIKQNLNPEQKLALLKEAGIKGKSPWDPMEVARKLHNSYYKEKISMDSIVNIMKPMTKNEITRKIESIELMFKNKDSKNNERYSAYEQIVMQPHLNKYSKIKLKTNKDEEVHEADKKITTRIFKEIKNPNFQAKDIIREKLAKVAKHPEIIRAWGREEISLTTAYDKVEDLTIVDSLINKTDKFATLISDKKNKNTMYGYKDHRLKRLIIALKKIRMHAGRVLDRFDHKGQEDIEDHIDD